MQDPTNIRLIQANYTDYRKQIEKLRSIYLDYPRSVSIETQVICNATCSFCAYPNSHRKGQKLSDGLFLKIIDDLSCIPEHHPFALTLHRINEPLLDSRMRHFHRIVSERLPNAHQQFWTNGTMLKEGVFEWMAQYPNSSLTISLNSVVEEEHVRLMGFSLQEVTRGLDYLHSLAERGLFGLPITLCAPFFSDRQAAEFQSTCVKRWPRFNTAVRPFFQWMGMSAAGAKFRTNVGLPGDPNREEIDSLPCGQWFDLHILANGHSTKCCIDETGHGGDSRFNANNRNVLEIYLGGQAMRESLPSRKEIKDCAGCLHLG